MNDALYLIGDLFQTSFKLIEISKNIPNLVLSISGFLILIFCSKVATSKDNICK